METGYLFALVFLFLALFNAARAWWAHKQGQKLMMILSLIFLTMSLGASAIMGVVTWRKVQAQTQVESSEDPAYAK